MITSTYRIYWYPSLPREQWTYEFELSTEEQYRDHTWTMHTREELELYAKYYTEHNGGHRYEKILEINRNRNENKTKS